MHSIYDEEKHLSPLSCICKSQLWRKNYLLLVTTTVDLLSNNFNLGIFLGLADWLDENLVFGSNDLMKSELKLTY